MFHVAALVASLAVAVVNPLSTPPTPPNGDASRAMFLWTKTTFDSDTEQQNILNFCGTRGVNVIYADAYGWIGGSNWDLTKLRQFVLKAHQSGIKVYALWGNVDWGTNHAWVQPNIVRKYEMYQAVATADEEFDGMMLDVEYWTDEGTYPASTNLPGLLDLVTAIQQKGIKVGLFAAFYLKDSTSTRATVTYGGVAKQDGAHMMDVADFIVVGAYRDHAEDNGTDGPGQISLFQPWYDYAIEEKLERGLYCGTETINISPSYITYFGATKSSMEAEHTEISDAFSDNDQSVWQGQAVHDYAGWNAMSN